jgi:hypothetical protein
VSLSRVKPLENDGRTNMFWHPSPVIGTPPYFTPSV